MRWPTPNESKVPTNKPNPPHFLWWHKVPKRKDLSSKKQILDIDQDKSIKRECSNKYKRAPPRLVHYLWFCIWIQNAHK